MLGFSSALPLLLSSSPRSLNPEISRRLRGRKEEDDAGVELVRTSLACIAGDLDYAVEAGDGESAALICFGSKDVVGREADSTGCWFTRWVFWP